MFLNRCLFRIREMGSFYVFCQNILVCLLPPYARFNFFFRQFIVMGINSIPIVVVVGAFVGMVLAVMTYGQFSKLEIESIMGPFIAIPIVRELGPIMTALMILCRVGSAMTAELGSMRVTEQIDALHCFGVNPMRNLIIPRVVACFFLLPCLTIISDAIGIYGGYFIAIDVYKVDAFYYMAQTRANFYAFDIFTGLAKASVFGVIISSICCFKGYNTRGGASGVGTSIMEAVVGAFVAIIVSNFFMSLLSKAIWDRFYA